MNVRELVNIIMEEKRKASAENSTCLTYSSDLPTERREIVLKRFKPYISVLCVAEKIRLRREVGEVADWVPPEDPYELVELGNGFTINGLNKATLSRAEIYGYGGKEPPYLFKTEFLVWCFPEHRKEIFVSATFDGTRPGRNTTAIVLPRMPEFGGHHKIETFSSSRIEWEEKEKYEWYEYGADGTILLGIAS